MRFVPKAATTVLSAVLGLGFVAVSTLPGFAADPGIYADRIVLGQTAALDGTVGQLGTEMRAGLLAAFKEANDAGGVNGRKIELVSLDDRYRATTALANTEQLLFTEGVYAMIGAVGTAPSEAAAQLSQDMGIPFIGAFTGSDALRQADYTNVVNIRASYDQETEAWVERLTAILKLGDRFVFGLTLLLVATLLLVIGNTIRLHIENRRTEIEVVKLVGGTDGYVRRPFLYMGALYGLGAGLIAWLLLVYGLGWLNEAVVNLAGLYGSDFGLGGVPAGDALSLVIGAVLLGYIGAWLAVARHLSELAPR